jgi:hypothetical protein
VIAQTLSKPSKLPPQEDLGAIDNKVLTDSLLKIDDFWLYPLAPSTTVRFTVAVDNTARSWVFRLLTEADNQIILTATMNGRNKTVGVNVTAGVQDRPIGEGKFDQAANAFFCGVALGTERGEAGCWVYPSKEFLMPAIKKIEGKSRMCLIPMGEASDLCARAAKGAKEAIRIKSVDPKGDLTFGGKFERQGAANCQLFHESNPKKMLCSFGARADGNWLLEVTYPLSPLQGFIIAVSATIP